MKDFTVICDPVNTAARPSEVLVTEDTYESVASQFPDTPQRTLELKGKAEAVATRVIRTSDIEN